MKTVISRRTLARIVSFSLAIIAVLGVQNVIYIRKLSSAEGSIEYGYRQAVEDLASGADKISSTLTKARYAKSPAMMTKLSSELMSEANLAKDALTKLPVSGMNLEKTEKFLSQIGNYAYAMAKRAADGEEFDFEDEARMKALCENAKTLSDSLWELKTRFVTNDKTIRELFKDLEGGEASFITDGFAGLEDGFANTPKLIYDGPFSDHIMDKQPAMLHNAPEISRDEALEKAALYCGVEDWELNTSEQGEEGKMPSYLFSGNGVNCAVTKNGGFISYMLKSREVRDSAIKPSDADAYAKNYLSSLGIENMEKTYYETYNNVTTINYAYTVNGVTCYTDLIKVSVALDNGEILGFDARGYIVNHHERDYEEPAVSAGECMENISSGLSVQKSSLAVIPVNSVDEKFCWEFNCRSQDDMTVLVYVNCMTGEEEDILILLETDESTLTV